MRAILGKIRSTVFAKAKKPTPPSPSTQPIAAEFPVAHFIDVFWCDRHGIYLQGWVHCYELPVLGVTLWQGDASFEVPRLRPRLDLLQFFPELPDAAHTGFAGYVEGPAGGKIRIEVHTGVGSWFFEPNLPKAGVLDGPWTEECAFKEDEYGVWWRYFVDFVNDNGLTVAEIGSRIVGEESGNNRTFFPKAKKFIGLDIHPAPGVDLVGDAHQLDKLVGRSGVDAVFSLSVLEHISHPWLLAAAINRALSIGGIVLHSAPQTYPLHEAPNDFWRFSSEGLKVLFGQETGFEVIAAGMLNQMDIYPEERRGAFALVPANPGWGNAYVLARKVKDLPDGAIAWPILTDELEVRSMQYPNWAVRMKDC